MALGRDPQGRRGLPHGTGPPAVGIYQSGVNLNQQIESKMGRNSKLKTKLGPFINQSPGGTRPDANNILQELNGIKGGQTRYKQKMNAKNNMGLSSQDMTMNSNLRETLQKFQHY